MVTDNLENLFQDFEKKLHIYAHGIKQRGGELKRAVSISNEELWNDLKKIVDTINESQPEQKLSLEMLLLSRNVLGGSVWIFRSYLRFLRSFVKTSHKHKIILEQRHDDILDVVINRVPFEDHSFNHSDILKTIFHDLCHSHDDPKYQTKLKMPKINFTVCLVSGALNELFSTPAFERGVKHLSEIHDFQYISADVHGRKDVKYNAQVIEDTLLNYIEENPDEKLWILAFSKGGIDALHFLKKNSEWANDHVIGLSTVASPIQGTLAASGVLSKIGEEINKYDDTWWYQKLDRGTNIFMKNFPNFLSVEYQKGWLKWNKDRFPNNLFYTSVAFNSPWYDAHIGMMATKLIFKNDSPNDGIVDIKRAHFPPMFNAINFGFLKGHHLISARSSTFNQEALIQSFLIALDYLELLPKED